MMRILPRLSFGMLAVLLTSGVSGCSDTLTGSQESFTDLVEPYHKTLTRAEQQAAIAELKNEAGRHENAADQPETTASVKPAASQ